MIDNDELSDELQRKIMDLVKEMKNRGERSATCMLYAMCFENGEYDVGWVGDTYTSSKLLGEMNKHLPTMIKKELSQEVLWN